MLVCLAAAVFWAAVMLGCSGAPATVNLRSDVGATDAATASATPGPSAAKPATRAIPDRVTIVPAVADINVPGPAGAAGPRYPSSIHLTGTVYNQDGSITTDLLWTSSNLKVARVSPDGLVTSVLPDARGVVEIRATSRLNTDLFATASITVGDFGINPATPSPVPVVRPLQVFVFPDKLDLNLPAEATAPAAVRAPSGARLVGTVFWSDGTISDDVVWESDTPNVVSVDASGSIQAVFPGATGSVVITATARASLAVTRVKGTATITVKQIGVYPKPDPSPVPASVAVHPQSVVVNTPPEPGQTSAGRIPSSYQFQATVFLTDGSLSTDVLWESSNTNLVQVSASGLASALVPNATGTAVLTARSRRNPTVSATASVTVQNIGPTPTPPPVLGVATVSIFPESATLNTPHDTSLSQEFANFATSVQLIGKVGMSDGSSTTDLIWSSSNADLVKVDQTGLASSRMIRGVGTVVVTAQSRFDPTKKATASVTVVDNGKVEIDVQ
jgi:hypothetical protein